LNKITFLFGPLRGFESQARSKDHKHARITHKMKGVLTNVCVPYFGGFDSDLLMVSWNSTRMIL